MIERCKLAQWRGYTPEERAWMTQASLMLRPTYLVLGHVGYPIWVVERYRGDWKYALLSGDVLLSVKIDRWPEEYEGTQRISGWEEA